MNFRTKRIFPGANPYAPKPMIEAQLGLPVGASIAPEGLAEAARLMGELMSGLKPASIDARTREFPPLAPPSLGEATSLLAYYAILLQRWAGYPLQGLIGRSGAAEPGLFAYEYRVAELGMAAGNAAFVLLEYGLDEHADSRSKATEAVRDFIRAHTEQTLIASYIKAADKRGVPTRILFKGADFLGFGQGRHQHRSLMNFTEATSHIATLTSTRKPVAAALFRAMGLPVPKHIVVADVEGALAAARQLGFPVVVKPAARDYGTAVSVDLRHPDEVRQAFAIAAPHGRVLVEEFIPGFQHRMMVIDGRLTSVRRHKPAHIVGDGSSSVRMLVEMTNQARLAKGWAPILLDKAAMFVLRKAGKTEQSIPEQGEEVFLRLQANLSTGGTMDVVSDITHPDNAALAIRAAAILGIDVAGVDFITSDISKSYLEAGGAICEINVTPGFIFDEEALLLEKWYPDGQDGRIPTIVFLDPEDERFARELARMLREHYPVVSLAARDGVFINETRIASSEDSRLRGSHIAIYEPSACAAVIECLSSDFLEQGLSLERCSVLVLPQNINLQQQRIVDILAPVADIVINDTECATVTAHLVP